MHHIRSNYSRDVSSSNKKSFGVHWSTHTRYMNECFS
jgi:hypothetical protein